jgi:hypothetical protein
MKRLSFLALIISLSWSSFTRADEGMWLASLLNRNYEDMKKHGLHLTPEQIYDINNASLKDAVVSLGGFCTAEVVSNQGLLLTNHHCGYDAIANSSTEEHNYLKNGFWAKELSQEIEIPDLTVTFVIRIEDVSDIINKELTANMTEDERNAKIKEISAKLKGEVTKDHVYNAFVRDFFEGNEFYMFVTQTFNDIRLVGAPPSDIGKFGYDTDNWVWPRHTGDFSMFRIYAGKDNTPSEYSADNKPYTPKHSLPISIKGIQENDYAMIMGFPGSTDRYLSSFGVTQAMNIDQPKRIELRAAKLAIMKKYMDLNETTHLKYASKYAQVANYWKYFIGQSTQLKNNHVVAKKEALEKEFNEFASSHSEYTQVMNDIESAYKTSDKNILFNVFINEAIFSVDVNLLAYRFIGLGNALESNNEELKKANISNLKEKSKEYFDAYNADIEGEIILEMYNRYYNELPREQQAPYILSIGDKSKGDFSKYVATIRKKSMFFSPEKLNAFLAAPDLKILNKDPLYKLIKDVLASIRMMRQNPEFADADKKLAKANRLFVKGLREMKPEKQFYPNANSTMRLTYGNVLPYEPRDAVKYDFKTTLEGVMEKEDPGNYEFNVPVKLKDLWEGKDYGRYADKDGKMHVNFLTNNDITGGNSGSPVINGDGQLIGIAFDGNWEAMSGDIYFEPNLQRTISVDIRYVLFIIDKYAGAQNLIDEMNIIQ